MSQHDGSGAVGDFVPLSERMAMLRAFRVLAAVVVVAAWVALPQARGASEALVVAVSLGYVAAMLLVEASWRLAPRRATWIFGVVVMCDALYLAWASYGTAGPATPLQALLWAQLVSVALLASFRTGLKLAMFSSLLLLCAYYAQQAHWLTHLGGRAAALGNFDYRLVCAQIVAFWLMALITATFSAVNERELRRRRYDVEALARLTRDLEASHEPGEIADHVLANVDDAFGYGRSALFDVGEHQLTCLAARGVDLANHRFLSKGTDELARDAPRIAATLADGATTLVRRAESGADLVLAFGPNARLIIVPLRADGRSIGLLVVEHHLRSGSRVERRVVSMLERFAAHAALALGKARLVQEIAALATIDGLTGIPNRRGLDQTLERACAEALRTGAPLGVLMIDVDHFKALNDTHGHQAGDEVLRGVAETISDQVRAMDTAARFGGEEFCVVMPGAGAATAAAAGERVRRAVAEAALQHAVTVSVGVACAPTHGRSALELTRSADGALYEAKRSGRDRVVVAAGAAPAQLDAA
jgi:diguanylate cyclase (GGDEF)-like protein